MNRRTISAGRAVALLAAAILGACSLGPGAREEAASYDFGPPAPAAPAAPALRTTLLVPDAAVPAWLDTPAMHYRLAYQDPTRPGAYANSRWMMPPAQLLTQRLRQRFAAASSAGVLVPADGVRAAHVLRIEIEEFAQVFDAPAQSRAVLRARASLLGSRALVAQRTFNVERAAASADAAGGARALIAVSDELVAQLLEWTATHARNP